MVVGFNDKFGVGFLTFDENQKRTSICLTKYQIDKITWSRSGKEVLAGVTEVGQLFYINVGFFFYGYFTMNNWW